MVSVPWHLRAYDRLRKFFNSARDSSRNFFELWAGRLYSAFTVFRGTWVYDHARFVLAYGLLLNVMLSALLGFPFDVFRIVGLGIAYYFFRLELFYWLRGVRA